MIRLSWDLIGDSFFVFRFRQWSGRTWRRRTKAAATRRRRTPPPSRRRRPPASPAPPVPPNANSDAIGNSNWATISHQNSVKPEHTTSERWTNNMSSCFKLGMNSYWFALIFFSLDAPQDDVQQRAAGRTGESVPAHALPGRLLPRGARPENRSDRSPSPGAWFFSSPLK